MDTSEDAPAIQAKRRRVDDLPVAFSVEKEVGEAHAQLLGPEVKAHLDATHASPLEAAGATISGWTANQ